MFQAISSCRDLHEVLVGPFRPLGHVGGDWEGHVEAEAGAGVGQKRKFESAEEGDAKRARQAVTLFVGNLPFSASEEDIRDFFQTVPLVGMRMMTDRDTGSFKGYGYVDFQDQQSADLALSMAGQDCCGRPIKIDHTKITSGGSSGGERSTTCYVGNLPFTADQSAIGNFFKECGSILSVRLVTDRETGNSKGFCFVEFAALEAADVAVTYHGSEFEGRTLRVTYDSPNPNAGRGGRGGRGDQGRGSRGRGSRGGDRGHDNSRFQKDSWGDNSYGDRSFSRGRGRGRGRQDW
jgi:nucleolin